MTTSCFAGFAACPSLHFRPLPPLSVLLPPCSFSTTIISLLSSALSSGLTIFSATSSSSSFTPPSAFALPFALFGVGSLACVPVERAPSACGPELPSWVIGLRWRIEGAGKLRFLSMASTVRWKRRKRAWARRRVEGRSIVLESSLTRIYSFRDRMLCRVSEEQLLVVQSLF